MCHAVSHLLLFLSHDVLVCWMLVVPSRRASLRACVASKRFPGSIALSRHHCYIAIWAIINVRAHNRPTFFVGCRRCEGAQRETYQLWDKRTRALHDRPMAQQVKTTPTSKVPFTHEQHLHITWFGRHAMPHLPDRSLSQR